MKYEEYKDSGMSWIGQVPTQWKRSRLKFLFSHSNAGVWGEEEKGDENDIACFRVADFDYQKGYLGFDKLTMRNITAKELEGRLLSQGSLLIEKSGGGDATPVGRVVRFNYEDKATCSNFVHFVTVDETHNSDFLYYYFYAMYANKENLLYFNQTTGIQNLKVGEYLGQSIFVPTFEEQQAIASYLDEKCGKINGAIDVQKKKIDLLNELKQTIITNAVTKGLNPDAPMKDSGVEWIGEVPVHWDMVKIKFNFNIYAGATPKSDVDGYWDGDIIWITPADYKTIDKYVSFGQRRITKIGYNSCNTQLVPKGSLIFSKRAPIGTVAIAETELCTNQGCLSCVPKKCSSLYYYYVTSVYTDLFDLLGSGATFKEISASDFANVKLPSPDYDEQLAIVSGIEKKVLKIDAQISKANRRIELLNELKQSVITEAVTGKIKVC